MARKLTLTPIVDPRQALQGFRTIQSGAAGVTGAFAGVGRSGHATFSGLAGAFYASGLPGQFGELQGLLSNVSLGFDQMGTKSKVTFGKVAIGAGVGLAALGGIGEQLASPLEAAQAQLKQSVSNAGVQWSAVSKPVAQQNKQMQSLGFTYTDTDQALALLTQGLGSPQKALKELGLDADLAARSGGTLAESAGTVVKAYAKSPMALRQFGINLTDTTKLGTQAVAAQKAHTKAITAQQKAQQDLSDLQARLGVSGDTKAAAAANSLTTAQNELATAGQHLQAVQAKISAGTGNAVTNQSELEAAQNRVAVAVAKVDQAQAKASDTAGLTVSQQQELAKATQKVSDANTLVASTGATAAATAGNLSKANITGQQVLDMLSKKTHGLAEAQSRTFGGDLRKWKATVIDFGATWGEKFAKPLIAIGPALAGVGTLIEVGFFGKIARGISGIVGGIGSLGKSILGIPTSAAGTAGTAPAAAGSAAGLELPAEFQSAGTELQTAAGALQQAAAQLSGAAGAEDTSASTLGTSAGALDTGAGALGTGAAGLDTSAGALGTSATGLDTAAAGLDAAGADVAVGSGAGAGGNFAKWASSAPVAPVLAAAGVAALGYGGLDAAKHLGGGSLEGNQPIISSILGGQQTVNGTPFVAPGQVYGPTGQSLGTNISGATGTPGTKGYKPPSFEPVPKAAAGALVMASPGGSILNVGEGGNSEAVLPLTTGVFSEIGAGLATALRQQGGGGGQAPVVISQPQAGGAAAGGEKHVHYHQELRIDRPTFQVADLSDLQRQMDSEHRRANFSGEGPPGGSDL